MPSAVFDASSRGTRLPLAAKGALVAEIARAYVPLRWTLRSRGLPAALELARRRPPEHADAAPPDADERAVMAGSVRLAAAVDRTLGALPADSRCLMRALVLCALLARRGVPSSFVIGVGDPGDDFVAHAWVELGGRPLQPPGSYPRIAVL